MLVAMCESVVTSPMDLTIVAMAIICFGFLALDILGSTIYSILSIILAFV
jgi:hypothetical protein